ncbi:MAG: 2-dehydropantoate 2-reductase [Candidatus Rokuibacteriota bacterium]|nr:MAG: 2-dehydropantoate 2-reductase [Candidatus Rokubacteria bacterium]
MRVAVVGCGAVGSIFAANLAQLEDVEVWAYDPWAEHVAAMNAEGLRLSGAGEVVGRVQATADAAEFPTCDFGIVATKSMQTAAAIAATAHVFRRGAVCSVQNGAGNEELIAEHVSEVIRGTTFPAGHVAGPGHVAWDTKGETHIGPFEPSPAPLEKVRALADACTRAGLPTQALEDARGAQWRKLIFNSASNAIGAVTGLTHGRIAEPPTRDLAWAVMAEGRAVSDAQDITLDSSPEELFDFAARREVAYDHKPSMLQDVEAGRETEIDFLNGAVVAFGERYGVDAPLNRALTALVKGLEKSRP